MPRQKASAVTQPCSLHLWKTQMCCFMAQAPLTLHKQGAAPHRAYVYFFGFARKKRAAI